MRGERSADPAQAPQGHEASGRWRIASVIDQVVRLRNWYVVYALLIFLVGGLMLHLDLRVLMGDALLYIAVFLVGYWLQGTRPLRVGGQSHRLSLRFVTSLVIALLVARLLVIGYQAIFIYGLRDYIAGAALVGQISDYGHYSVANGLYTVLNSVLNFSTVAACSLYVRECLLRQRSPRFDLVIGVMIGAPILELQRSFIIFGVVFVGVAYIYTARLRGYELTRRFVAVVVAGILALGAGMSLGLLRANALFPGSLTSQSVGTRVVDLVRGEVSPVLVYSTIRTETGRAFGFQWGQTIVGPLAFKLVPRSWAPNKPINSAAFYAVRYQASTFASGFVISPTFWSALYLNFGYVGSVLGSFLLGVMTSRVDRIFTEKRTHELGWLLIVYYNYYLLLRQDVADMLAVFILTGAVYFAFAFILRERPEASAAEVLPSR